MVILPAAMTEYDNGTGAFSASAFVADHVSDSSALHVTDMAFASGIAATTPAARVTDIVSPLDF